MNRLVYHHYNRGLPQDLNGLQGWRARAHRWWRKNPARAESVPSQGPGAGERASLDNRLFEFYLNSRWKLPGFLLQAVLDTYIALDNCIGILRGQGKENEAVEGDAITEQSSDLMSARKRYGLDRSRPRRIGYDSLWYRALPWPGYPGCHLARPERGRSLHPPRLLGW